MSQPGNGHPFARARIAVTACVLLLGASAARSDKLRSENVTIAPRNAQTATVRFDIAWENSWRSEVNHDAAWVFFKVKAEGETEWQHVRLAADKALNPTGYKQAEGGTQLDFIVPDGNDGFTGLFVRRTAEGRGAVAARGVTAVWNLKANQGIGDINKAQIRAFGIEMAYVAKGPFYLGSGGTEWNRFYRYTDGSQNTLPYRVTCPGAIPTGRQGGKLWVRSAKPYWPTDAEPADNGEVPASFPNGYAAVYCMVFPIKRSQYAGFLNSLPPAEAKKRFNKAEGWPLEYHNGAYIATDNPRAQLSQLSWADGAAYATWAGFRPMTELEYEKAMRGPREPVPFEAGPTHYGARSRDPVPYTPGPSFWGLRSGGPGSQNVAERAVSVAHAAGRKFAGTHGLGTPAPPADWPQDDAVGAGFRSFRISDRLHAADVDADVPAERVPHLFRGMRCARTAPEVAEPSAVQGKADGGGK